MNESDVRLALHHALQYLGYWPKHDQDARKYPVVCQKCHHTNWFTVKPEVKGRPDTESKHPLFPAALIEVKAIGVNDMAFSFDSVTPEQHDYLSSWHDEGGLTFLCVGKIVPMGSRSKIDSIAVIPWGFWLKVMAYYISPLRRLSAPWDYTLYTNKPTEGIPDLKSLISFDNFLFKDGTDWHFMASHPLAVQLEVEVPFFKRVRNAKETNGLLKTGELDSSQ